MASSLLDWHPVPLPPNVHSVYKIIVVNRPYPQILIIATDHGIWWGTGSGSWNVTQGPAYWDHWMETAFCGLAPVSNGVVAGVLYPQKLGRPLLMGSWDPAAGTLVFKDSGFKDLAVDDRMAMEQFSIASCDADPSVAYAICFHNEHVTGGREDELWRILRSMGAKAADLRPAAKAHRSDCPSSRSRVSDPLGLSPQ
jgi:hypothetical protein